MTGEGTFRPAVRREDAGAVRRILVSTGFFHPDEIEVAVELVEERLARGEASGYFFLFADGPDGVPYAYTCYGHIPGTASSYDLYWIAVAAEKRGEGTGRLLLKATERQIASRGGRRVYVETSSQDLYIPTRAFYVRCGYAQEARLADFYRPGDSKVIFVKELPPGEGEPA